MPESTKKIYLTIDTECHDYSIVNQYIHGKTKKGEFYGIKKILELSRELGITANFFVDVVECRKYGDEYVKEIVDLIHKYHQPVFFHLHPNYVSGDERSYMWEYTKEEQRDIFQKGLEDYRRFAGEQDRIVFRAGRYGVNSDFYEVLKEQNLDILDLSVCSGCPKMCKITHDQIGSYNKPTYYNDILLLPNTRFVAFDYFGIKRCVGLDSADATYDEFRRILKNTKLTSLVWTMHSWNFILKFFFCRNRIWGNKMMVRKFRKSVKYAQKSGFEFSDLRNFKYEESPDEFPNLCDGFMGKIKGLLNNIIRFAKIARLNKKYFALYTVPFLVLLIILLIILLF